LQVVLVRHDGDDPADAVSTDTRDLEDGTYEATYVTNTAGVYELSVLCRGAHVADSPYPVRVLPGPAEFAKTLVTGVETRLTVGKATTFEIHACDRFGNRYDGEHQRGEVSGVSGERSDPLTPREPPTPTPGRCPGRGADRRSGPLVTPRNTHSLTH
jgi:hypothetical protein